MDSLFPMLYTMPLTFSFPCSRRLPRYHQFFKANRYRHNQPFPPDSPSSLSKILRNPRPSGPCCWMLKVSTFFPRLHVLCFFVTIWKLSYRWFPMLVLVIDRLYGTSVNFSHLLFIQVAKSTNMANLSLIPRAP